jgi:predicted nucleic-acid-binding protein
MRAVDTNVLVRLIARDDPKQVGVAEAFVGPGAWVSHVVLAETIWVLASIYEFDTRRLALAVELLLGHDKLVLQDPEVVSAALAAFRSRPKSGFSDCLVCEVARKAGHQPLGTFDRELARLDGVQRL